MIQKLTPETMEGLPLQGRAFLHQQGSTICRGYVERFYLTGDSWRLELRNVEAFDWNASEWRHEYEKDEYGGTIAPHSRFELDTDDGILSIYGYGAETHIGPECASPWSEIDWPETDSYPGGPMIR